MKTFPILTAILGLLSSVAPAADGDARPATDAPRYTFSWRLDQADAPQPRGGSTRGAPVSLDTEPSAQWRALQEPGIDRFERDRRAILAMAGSYQVTFDFLEVQSFKTDTPRARPYQSWGTERVYVAEDKGRFISLVHMLEMRTVDESGKISEPMVTKHWRQDWQYEPTDIVEYRGRERWERRRVSGAERRGRWSQSVYQVDESPRYASIGRWEHNTGFSSWISADTWRPLPRREWTVRKDYQVLLGTNRHTVTSTGWTQEENNLKAVLTEARTPDATLPYLAREYGVARYSRLRDADFAAADQYWQRTQKFWNQVRDAWADTFRRSPQVTLGAAVDQANLFAPLFDHAEQLAQDRQLERDTASVIRTTLDDMLGRASVTK